MNTQRFRGWLRPLLIIILVAGALVVLIYTFEHVTGTRVVVQATMPNGVEIMIKQSFNWSGEPFTTGFYYRRPGGPWIWRYYSHEDGYWGRGRVVLDESTRIATVERGGKPTIKFNWETLEHTQFTETQDGRPRTFTPAEDR